MMNDRVIKFCQYSVGKYWKRCRLTICLALGFINTCILPELVFAEGALPHGLCVERECSFKCICLPLSVGCIWICFTVPPQKTQYH